MPCLQRQNSPLGDQILQSLRDDICALRLPPGIKLKNSDLLRRFSAGQSPIREALFELTGEGLVLRESRRGFQVKPMSLLDFDDLTETRINLEIALLNRVLASPRRDWTTRLTAALEEMALNTHKVGDARPVDRNWERSHRNYHFSLIDAYHSPHQLEFCRRIYNHYDRYRILSIPRRAFLAATADDHSELFRVALTHDAKKTATILTRHIIDTSATIRTNIETSGLIDKNGIINIDQLQAKERSR